MGSSHSGSFFARAFLAISLLISASELLIAYLMQQRLFIMPCPLCIIQRYILLLVAIFSFVAFFSKGCIRLIYMYMGLLSAFAGLCAALYQVYIQIFPVQEEQCSVAVSNYLNDFFLARWFPDLFLSAGDCSVIQWRLFGVVTIPEISAFLFFTITALLSLSISYYKSAGCNSDGDKSGGCHSQSCKN
ncbi:MULTISPECIES: disulfide bond formation protein B [Candidatus Ichthyocystis]|uniref:disulfide bond formation protein B n=1 Tax=Candidatus Ichthyocystis TaxID=2929841 RepID=UPI000B806BBD|nr:MULTISPECIES: disulfide bond formation protein B [Ichthyocystis]